MVLQALQLQTPKAKLSVTNTNTSSFFFIIIVVFVFVVSVHYLVEQDLEEGYSCHVGEDAPLGVFREGAAVDAYAGTFGDVEDFGQRFLELGRPGVLDGVRTCGDEVVGVLEGREGAGNTVKLEG